MHVAVKKASHLAYLQVTTERKFTESEGKHDMDYCVPNKQAGFHVESGQCEVTAKTVVEE